jgi:colanic acid/amylovoran biosynthesis glycosyltransferase
MPRTLFAYVFKRFPIFAQTFIVREIEGVFRHQRHPAIFSIQPPEDGHRQDDFQEMEKQVQVLPSKGALSADIFRKALSKALPFHTITSPSWLGKKKRAHREALWLGPELKSRGITRLHTHFTGEAARTAWWVHRLFGIPYSITAHANDFLCSWESTPNLEQLVTDAKAIIAVSDFSKAWFERKFPSANIQRVYNGMNLGYLPQQSFTEIPHIVSVGRLVEKKGFPDLIKACHLMKREQVDFQCQLVGEGPLEAALSDLIKCYGLEENVTLHGALPQSEIKQMLQQASIFALACIEEKSGGMDILPTVITEAMAACLPVVSTRLAGIPEMVSDGQTGFLTEPGDVQAFANALKKLLANPQNAREMGIQGRRRAEAIFDERVTIPQLLRILEN